MTDPFVELDDQMSRVNQTATNGDPASVAEQVRQTLSGKHVCPYCGHAYPGGPEPCPRCTMEDSPATRQATKARIGPWYVLQTRNPAAPGMKYATMLALINKGQITPRSIVRGPTTHQLWRFAAHVRGISREFGLCYSCGGPMERTGSLCPHCQRSQEPPLEPDQLLESRTSSRQTHGPAPEPPAEMTYSARMRELNRQRAEAAAAEAHRNAGMNGHGGVARIRQDPSRRVSPDGRIVSAMELAAALQDDPSRALRPPRRWFIRMALLLILLAGAGGAAVLYFVPEYRQPTYTWLNDTWTTIKTKVSSIDWPKFKTTPAPTPTPDVRVPRRDHPPVADAPKPAVQDQNLTEGSRDAQELQAIARDQTSKPQQVISPPPQPTQQKPAQSASQQPKSQPQQAQQQPDQSNDPDSALRQSRKLYSDAIDAERHGDFATAVKLYEQMKQLPPEVWYKDLDLRLELARKRLESSSSTSAR